MCCDKWKPYHYVKESCSALQPKKRMWKRLEHLMKRVHILMRVIHEALVTDGLQMKWSTFTYYGHNFLDKFSCFLFPQTKAHVMFIYSSFTTQNNVPTKDCNEPRHLGLYNFITMLIWNNNYEQVRSYAIKRVKKIGLKMMLLPVNWEKFNCLLHVFWIPTVFWVNVMMRNMKNAHGKWVPFLW